MSELFNVKLKCDFYNSLNLSILVSTLHVQNGQIFENKHHHRIRRPRKPMDTKNQQILLASSPS